MLFNFSKSSYNASVPGKPRFVFQWHITEACNLHCSHCYQEDSMLGHSSWEMMMMSLDRIEEFHVRRRLHINITGGEPFLHPEFRQLLALLKKRKRYSVGILSNGTLIDESWAEFVASAKVRFVQVSIDGPEYIHDRIRGSGNFEKAVDGIRALKKKRIQVLISFTAGKMNYLHFPSVAELGKKLGVDKIWCDRLIPAGNADRDMSLDADQTRDLMRILSYEQKTNRSKTEIALHRALQFLMGDGPVYQCQAARSLLAIMPDGEVYPCRRLPVRIGKIRDGSLLDMMRNSAFARSFSGRMEPEGCRKCFYSDLCRGGLKCLAYALKGKISESDPGCWLASDNVSKTFKGEYHEFVCKC